jgi:phage tail tape-measure protein
VSILLCVMNWLVLANEIPAIGVIARSLAAASVTIAELLVIVVILGMLLGSVLSAQLGDKVQKWNGIGRVFHSLFKHFVVGSLLHSAVSMKAF